MMEVTGFHACSKDFAANLRSGSVTIDQWRQSENDYDWLGNGIYFWESEVRARKWAKDVAGVEGDVVAAKIDLGVCFDLMDTEHLELLRETYESLAKHYRESGWALPTNREPFRRSSLGHMQRETAAVLDWLNSQFYPILTGKAFARFRDCKLRYLDCLVMNQFVELMETGHNGVVARFQSVRGAFEEGDLVFRGSMIRDRTHIQIAVRDTQCIIGVES